MPSNPPKNAKFVEKKRPYVVEFIRYASGFVAIVATGLFMLTLASKAAGQ